MKRFETEVRGREETRPGLSPHPGDGGGCRASFLRLTTALIALCAAVFFIFTVCAGAAENPSQNKKRIVPEHLSIIIDMDRLTLTLFDGGEPIRQYPVAMGKYETPTPTGNWEIVSHDRNPPDVMGSRWLGLNIPYGSYGIHGTNAPYSIGSFASHGCIRMHNTHVEEIYALVTASTPVIIIGSPFGPPGMPPSTLRMGDRGPDVLEVQRALKRLGYLRWTPDGFFGQGTREAVKKFRADNGLKGEPLIDDKVYQLLGYGGK